jgi:hypothetical protein
VEICDHHDELTLEQCNAAGIASRRLLEYAWSQSSRNGFMVIHAIQCVCRTFESNLKDSVNLIRRCLEPEHFSNFGYEEMPWLAREVKRLGLPEKVLTQYRSGLIVLLLSHLHLYFMSIWR